MQDQLIRELKKVAAELDHSPQRREVPNLAVKCYKQFGSFNKAKLIAGLEIKNVNITEFPKNAFKLDKDLVAIVSYVTFDGHLYKNFKGFYYSSKNINDLKIFKKIVKRKFGLPARYHLFNSGSRNQTHMIYFFNKQVCEFLFKSGAPKGDKAIQIFDVPEWIVKSREFSREYLKIAYLCEGSIKEKDRKNPRISFTQSKQTEILNSGLKFMNTIKSMLADFDINTTDSCISGMRIRKRDGKMTQDIRFRIKTADNDKFISEIGWLK